jgi:hypothetical protein
MGGGEVRGCGFDMMYMDTPRPRPSPEMVKALRYSQKLLTAVLELIGVAFERVKLHEINQNGTRDPKIVGLTILCRSISDFRAAILLVQLDQALEATALVRLLYENLLWIAALQERGLEFVADMRADEVFSKRALGELLLEFSDDVSAPAALELRTTIKDLGRQFPKRKKLHARKTAAEGPVERAYYDYAKRSLNAVHCSVTALGRHLSTEHIDGKSMLKLSIVPRTAPDEVLSTVLHACRTLMSTALVADELTGCTISNAPLMALYTEFESNGWRDRCLRGGLFG